MSQITFAANLKISSKVHRSFVLGRKLYYSPDGSYYFVTSERVNTEQGPGVVLSTRRFSIRKVDPKGNTCFAEGTVKNYFALSRDAHYWAGTLGTPDKSKIATFKPSVYKSKSETKVPVVQKSDPGIAEIKAMLALLSEKVAKLSA